MKKPQLRPVRLMVSDAAGTILLAIGMVNVVIPQAELPEPMRFGDYGVALIVIGAALMVPTFLYFVRRSRERENAPSP